MKFCVSIRQDDSILQQADEIFVEMRDIKGIYNFVDREEFKNKTFILQIPYTSTIDWTEIKALSQRINLICAVEDFEAHASNCKEMGLRFYWNYPITSFYEAEGAVNNGVCYLKLGAPLYFSLPETRQFQTPIRLIANVCHDNIFQRENGICGTYVRPEDIGAYEPYVDALEFAAPDLRAEAALFDTYKKGKWPGNLNILLTNFDCNVDNRAIVEEFGPARVQCQQKCKSNRSCHFCESAILFAQSINKYYNKN